MGGFFFDFEAVRTATWRADDHDARPPRRHQMDMDRMPVCRWGENCRIKDCPYKHEAEADKPQCVFYQQGFCYHGPECRYRHWKQAADKRPAIADFSLGIAQGRDFKQAAAERRRPSEARPVGMPSYALRG